MWSGITKSKNVWTLNIYYIDLNFLLCKTIEFTLNPLTMLKALGLSQVVTKRKPTEAYRNGARLLMKIPQPPIQPRSFDITKRH